MGRWEIKEYVFSIYIISIEFFVCICVNDDLPQDHELGGQAPSHLRNIPSPSVCFFVFETWHDLPPLLRLVSNSGSFCAPEYLGLQACSTTLNYKDRILQVLLPISLSCNTLKNVLPLFSKIPDKIRISIFKYAWRFFT
jgi:hypothetical protein